MRSLKLFAKAVLVTAFLALPFVLIPASGEAMSDFAAPQGPVILEIEGNIARTNDADGRSARFDLALLESLPQQVIATTSDWTDGVQRFEGPLVRDLLAFLGAKGEIVVATALNDYEVEVPISDFGRYAVILAHKQNGRRLSARDKGPIWIVYPRDAHPELNDPLINARWIWQLQKLSIR